jgi:cytochrome P450
VGLFWAAGFETTAHTICWTLFLLATHPDAEAKLCAELATLGLLATPEKPVPNPLQWEHLAQVWSGVNGALPELVVTLLSTLYGCRLPDVCVCQMLFLKTASKSSCFW